MDWTAAEISILGNSLRGAINFCVLAALIFVLRIDSQGHEPRLLPELKNALKWFAAAVVFGSLHRLYWNAAVWFAPAGKNWSPWFIEHKAWLTVLNIGLVVCMVRAITHAIPPVYRRRMLSGCGAFAAVYVSFSVWLA